MVNEFNVIMGKRISKLRIAKGWNREEAAFQASMSPKFLYEVEHGKRSITAEKLVNLAKALNISCDYLLLGDAEEDENKDQNASNIQVNQNGFWKK